MHVGAKQGYFVNDNTSFLKENTCKIYVIKPRQPPNLKTHLIGKEGGAPGLMRDFLPGKVAEDERITHPRNPGFTLKLKLKEKTKGNWKLRL